MMDLIPQLRSLFKGVWKYRWIAMIIAWIVLIIGTGVVYYLPNDYQASARVYVDTQSILKPLLSGMTNVQNVEQQVQIMSRTLLSRPNIERVMRMVDLDVKAKTAKEHEKMVDDLTAQIKILSTGRDDIYTITYNNENPKLGKDVVQSLLTIFVEGSFGDKKQDSEKAIRFIEDQIKNYEDKLVTAENALKEFKLKHMGMLPKEGSDYGAKLTDAQDQLNQARLDLAESEQSRNAIKRQIDGSVTTTKGETTPGPMPTPELDARIAAVNKSLDGLRMQYTEEHPDIMAAKRLLAQLEAKKLEESRNIRRSADPGAHYSPMLQQLNVELSSAEAKVAAMRARVEEYTGRVARLKAQSVAAPEIEAEFAQLNRDYQVNKENYEKLLQRRESAKLSGELSNATDMMTFRVIDPPTVPLLPAGPNRPRLMGLVFVAAIGLGIGVAFLFSQVRPTFLSQADLRSISGLPILGSVSMNWTDVQRVKQRRSILAFGASGAALFVTFGGIMAVLLAKMYA